MIAAAVEVGRRSGLTQSNMNDIWALKDTVETIADMIPEKWNSEVTNKFDKTWNISIELIHKTSREVARLVKSLRENIELNVFTDKLPIAAKTENVTQRFVNNSGLPIFKH